MKIARKQRSAFVAIMMLAQAVIFTFGISWGQQNPPLLQISSPATSAAAESTDSTQNQVPNTIIQLLNTSVTSRVFNSLAP